MLTNGQTHPILSPPSKILLNSIFFKCPWDCVFFAPFLTIVLQMFLQFLLQLFLQLFHFKKVQIRPGRP